MKKLFANGEQGFYQDPYDPSTMYQDAAGTVPVTGVGQPVGLILDKSKGLMFGPELMSGGNFEAGLIGSKWDGFGSVSSWELNTISPISGTQDGKLIITTSAGGRPGLTFLNNTKVVGELYELSFDYKVTSGLVKILAVSNGASTLVVGSNLSSFGKFKARYIALGNSDADIIYFGDSVGTIQIDNLSVKRVLGNHAYQSKSSMRPLLVASPQRLDFDAVDDKLITNLSAQLTGCTVIRSVPNVGTQILTGQTIPATYEDSTDHCGLIVINRALTPSETSAIAAEFNKRAGV